MVVSLADLVPLELGDGGFRVVSDPGIGVRSGGFGQRAESLGVPDGAERCRRTLADRGMDVAECSDEDLRCSGISDLAERFGSGLADGLSPVQ